MTPAMLAAIITLVEEAVTQAPALVAEFQGIFTKPTPTSADWLALRNKVMSQSYESIVTASQIPPGQ